MQLNLALTIKGSKFTIAAGAVLTFSAELKYRAKILKYHSVDNRKVNKNNQKKIRINIEKATKKAKKALKTPKTQTKTANNAKNT